MKTLNENWITEGVIDFEHKKYLLLAFLQNADTQFRASKLFPVLSELVKHYRFLETIRSEKEKAIQSFPSKLEGLAKNKFELLFSTIVQDNESMQQIEEIITFALPRLEDKLQEGQEIFEFVESSIALEPVGIEPLYLDEGYLLLHDQHDKDVLIYRYNMALIESSNARYRSLATTFLGREKKTIAKTFENIKLQLVDRFTDLPNPATWAISSEIKFPLIETFLPVAKRLMMRRLHSQ